MKQMLAFALALAAEQSPALPWAQALVGPGQETPESPEGGLVPLGGDALWSSRFITSGDQL